MPYGSPHEVTKIMTFHPYRIHVHVMHEFNKHDKGKGLRYCQRFVATLDKKFILQAKLAWFLIMGMVIA